MRVFASSPAEGGISALPGSGRERSGELEGDEHGRTWRAGDQDSREGWRLRVICVASIANAVYVLHCFQKNSQETQAEDIELARRRYKELVRELRL